MEKKIKISKTEIEEHSAVLQIYLWKQEKKYLDLAIHELELPGHKLVWFCPTNTLGILVGTAKLLKDNSKRNN